MQSSWVKVWLGEPEAAIERAARAMRLSPNDPQVFNMQAGIAAAHFVAGRYADALSSAELSIHGKPDYTLSTFVAAASAALAGDKAAAKKATARLRGISPELRISNLSDHFPIRRPEDFKHWVEGLRKAGLPE